MSLIHRPGTSATRFFASCFSIAAPCVLSILALPGAGRAQTSIDVRYDKGLVSVHAVDAALPDVVAQLATLTALDVTGLDALSGRTSIDLVDVRLEAALARLLDGWNYVVVEHASAAAGRPRLGLYILARGVAESSARGAARRFDPIHVPALDTAVAAEAAEEAENSMDEDLDADWDDEKRENRFAAARLSSEGAFGPGATVRSLLAFMEDEDNPEIRLAALHALDGRSTSTARRRVAEALGDEAWTVRSAAVDLLGRARDAESLHLIEEMLATNADPVVRLGALRVLAQRAARSPSLHAALRDSDATIRDAAAQVLAELDRRAAAPAGR